MCEVSAFGFFESSFMSGMSEDLKKRVVMTKKVANRYLEKISSPKKSLTVYFSDGDSMESFLSDLRSKYGSKFSEEKQFDYVTFLSDDHDIIDRIKREASDKGFSVSSN